MASVNWTATPYSTNRMPMCHEGLNVIYGQISATLCASGALFMAKIPHGARIIDGWVDLSLQANADIVVGLAGAADTGKSVGVTLITSCSTTTVTRFFTAATAVTDGQGYKVSVSDDATNRWMTLKMSGSVSWGGTPIKFVVMYLTDGQ